MKNYEIEKRGEHRTLYTFKETNAKNERLVVEITECYYNTKDKNSLPCLWKQNGYTNKLYDNALHVDCYCYEENGNCYGRYNPTVKRSEDGKRMVINFDNLLEVSEENKKILLNKIYTQFMEVK